ncbi:MAG: DUF1294 domain-containing protein [Oscillospiraceae bacterium]|nr:DUF1294 domain-containing protein [Oscillospiraceae bacterium]
MSAGMIALCGLSLNVLSLLIFGLDKALAVGHKRRIREATLLTLSLFGGSIGAMLAMTAFHHKTDARAHPAFVWGVPAMFLLEMTLLTVFFGGQ